jgi:hypothetical protein
LFVVPRIIDLFKVVPNPLMLLIVSRSVRRVENTKVVIRISISKKKRQHNDKKKKYKRPNNDL